MTKASIFYGKEGALIFLGKGGCPRGSVGVFLHALIIYCIRYIGYAKVENHLISPILSESVKSYF